MTPDSLVAAITARTSAVIVVHLYGQIVDMDAARQASRGQRVSPSSRTRRRRTAPSRHGRPAGSFGVAGCFSFYPGKNLGAFGDAGAVVTSDAALAARLRSLRNHGRLPGAPHRHDLVGTNSRMDTIQAAVLTRSCGTWTGGTRHGAARGAIPRAAAEGPVRLCRTATPAPFPRPMSPWPSRANAKSFGPALARHGVATALHYPLPCHRQEPYLGMRTDRYR